MKSNSNVWQVLKSLLVFLKLPCVVFLVSLLLVAGGYLGVYVCDSLNRHFPLAGSPINPKTFFGRFDGLAALCILASFAGEVLGVISFVWIVVGMTFWPFRQRAG